MGERTGQNNVKPREGRRRVVGKSAPESIVRNITLPIGRYSSRCPFSPFLSLIFVVPTAVRSTLVVTFPLLLLSFFYFTKKYMLRKISQSRRTEI